MNERHGNGFYEWGSIKPKNAPTLLRGEGTYMYMFEFGDEAGFTQIMGCYIQTSPGLICRQAFAKSGGVQFAEWEWINPPMALNTEYRTTERYMGKPVYAKLVNCEALPNAGYKTVSVGVSGLEKVIDVSGCAIDAHNDDFYSIPATNFSSSVHNVGLYVTGSQAIAISTQSDRSSYNAYVKVKYTKTTD